ncbi:apolipoprotein N-acyltransferase [Actinorugispora endophytica]|uniref:Apolipoprotein N-acyltransferase n=1 Tax=Actinorugispora endophytica TaxID=1605990 RepID=A0A4R6UG20_9ACTN|nr:apolipoprotein N-acyltransferase [Actinorugispora endophytica]TDQ45718.1 apolipoprotein N-acyltransferase [Actinorugispora endophytica]
MLLLRVLAAAVSGLAQLAALPPYGLWALAPFSAALLLAAVHGVRARRAAWLGAVAGASLMVPLVKWQEIFGVDVWLVIAAAETVYYIPMAMGIALVSRLPGWPVWTAALWVAQEFCRARFPLGGFPWGKLAFSQPDTVFSGYASLGSTALVTFMVALTGALVVAMAHSAREAIRTGRPHLFARPLANALALIMAVVVGGVLAPRLATPEVDHTTTVAIVQGNVPAAGEMDILGKRAQILQNHVDGVHELAGLVREGEVAQPDLVVLPENASDIDAYADPMAAALISDAAEDIGVPLMFGITRYSEDATEREIRSVVWDPETGPGDHYTKRYLVPFGEYIPFRAVFSPVITRLQRIGSDAVPGTEPGALEVNGTTVATVICFDVAFDRPVRESVAAGGQIIAVPTNNANYNFTGQSEQQLAITRLRAVEHGRPALVASTSGISAVVTPQGRVSYRSPEAEAAVHVAEVPAMSGLTPATRLGVLPEAALTLMGLGAVAVALVRARRVRSGAEPEAPVLAGPGE